MVSLNLSLAFSLSSHSDSISDKRPSQGGRASMVDDWARKTFEKIKHEDEERKRSEDLELHRAKLVSSHAEHVWNSLVTAIDSRVSGLNNLFGNRQSWYLDFKLSVNNDELNVRSPKARLHLEFDRKMPSINSTIIREAGPTTRPQGKVSRYVFDANGGQVSLHEEGSSLNVNVEELAEELLDSIT